jgi:hypothetical protein
MVITADNFCRLPLPEQLSTVLRQGTFLTLRYEETYAVTHYLLNGFFADLYYSQQAPWPERIQVLDDQLW